MNLDSTFAMIFPGVLQLEKVGTALDVIQIGVREGHDIEIVAIRLFEVGLQARFEINFRRARVFSFFAVAKVEQDTATAGQDDLGRITVADRIENDLMFVCYDGSSLNRWPIWKN